MHHLTLLPYPTYYGSFLCNSCGLSGYVFWFRCPICYFNLHVHCAFLIQILHHQTPVYKLSLSLTYAIPHLISSAHVCSIFHKELDFRFGLTIVSAAHLLYEEEKCCLGLLMKHKLRRKRMVLCLLWSNLHSKKAQIEITALWTLSEMYKLQLQMETNQQFAKVMASSFNLALWYEDANN